MPLTLATTSIPLVKKGQRLIKSVSHGRKHCTETCSLNKMSWSLPLSLALEEVHIDVKTGNFLQHWSKTEIESLEVCCA